MKQGRYFADKIEAKWRENWKKQNSFEFKDDPKKQKYYNLVELPYPSGDLHLGHWFAFVPADVHARFKKMSGFNVFYPNGFDAFGLPAENAAIKRGIHPRDWTMKNIEVMRTQFDIMGTMIDWTHSTITCLPDFYRWNQWIFLKMFEKGIAYRGIALSNWCPTDQTVLANEHIEAGKCWRCGAEVVQKEVEQWFLAITKYAESLIWKNPPQADWPKQVIEGQNNWIGKSEGMLIDFSGIEVFTTKPETIDGATFLVVAPEHEFVKNLSKTKEVEDYVLAASKKTEMERKEDRTKSGVFSGKYVKNPVTGKDVPVWISDYVLAGYGTGAIMAVPYVDERDREFAQKFNLPIIETKFNAKPKGEKTINYHLRDWSISRQRYWGTPVPIIHCEKCGLVPVPEKDLPVELPYNVDYTPKGKPPLASDEKWLNVKCPKCGGEAKRDAETLDTFFDSAWYYYRYVSPEFHKGPFDPKEVAKLMPVDVYFGGSEHTLGHTLYARFFTKFFKELGLLEFDEFAKKRIQHGVILGPDGDRMSKSRGNVVSPDDVVKEYGADTVRLYLCFMMPYEATSPWSPTAIGGVYKFLKRAWDLLEKVDKGELSRQDLSKMHQAIKKVGVDLENLAFNTAVSSLMIWLNHLTSKKTVTSEEYKTLLRLLAPFAPHITDELWHLLNPNANSVHLEDWPVFQSKYLISDSVNIAVQVNGKLRDAIVVKREFIKSQEKVENEAKSSQKVAKYLTSAIKKVIYIEGKIINFVV
ncbi:MAG: leucine--tRNA ligase [Candidatus Levybacteria bacterium]|nr:leucine--tRNA ligase [Candidatus Levybacteria bacterium]